MQRFTSVRMDSAKICPVYFRPMAAKLHILASRQHFMAHCTPKQNELIHGNTCEMELVCLYKFSIIIDLVKKLKQCLLKCL